MNQLQIVLAGKTGKFLQGLHILQHPVLDHHIRLEIQRSRIDSLPCGIPNTGKVDSRTQGSANVLIAELFDSKIVECLETGAYIHGCHLAVQPYIPQAILHSKLDPTGKRALESVHQQVFDPYMSRRIMHQAFDMGKHHPRQQKPIHIQADIRIKVLPQASSLGFPRRISARSHRVFRLRPPLFRIFLPSGIARYRILSLASFLCLNRKSGEPSLPISPIDFRTAQIGCQN